MKKLFFLFAALIIVIGLQAQDFRSVLQPDVTYRLNNVNATVSDTSTYEVQWEVRSHYPWTFSVAMDIDSILGVSGKDTMHVYTKIGTEDTWSLYGSVVPTANSQTLRLTNDTSAIRARFIKALYTKTDTSDVKIDYHWLKIWRE